MLIGLLIYLLITGYILISYYYFLTGKYGGSYSFADRLLGTFVLAISQIILTEMVLGFALQLNSLNLLILNLVISTCIMVVSGVRRNEIARQFGEAKHNIVSFLRLVVGNKLLLLLFILAGIQVAWWAFLVYLFPPYAWDDLMYHLPKMAYILQSNGIKEFQTMNVHVNQFPFNSELLCLWNVIYLRNDILVNGTQVIFALFAVLAIYSLARKAGVKQQNAAWALIFLFIPIVIQQATTCYIDIIMSALLIGAVNFMLLRDKPKIGILIFGLIIGILLGSKYSYIGPCLVVSLAFWVLILTNIRKDSIKNKARLPGGNIAREIMMGLALYLVPVLILGGTWYLRNYLLFGNPVAPYQIELFGHTLAPGALDPATGTLPERAIPIWFEPWYVVNVWVERWAPLWAGSFYSYDGSRGFGPMFWILLVPSGIFSIIIASRRRSWDYVVAAAVFICCFLATPYDWMSRYTIFICGFGILSFCLAMEYLNRPRTIALMALPVIVLTMLQGNYQTFINPGEISIYMYKPLEQRQSSDFIGRTSMGSPYYAPIYQAVSKQKKATVLCSFPPQEFLYPLWDSGFTNTILAIPGEYTTGKIFMDYIRKYGACYIVATDDTDIVKHYNTGRARIRLVYQLNNYWVFYYPGEGVDEQKD